MRPVIVQTYTESQSDIGEDRIGPTFIIALKVGLRKKAELDAPVLWVLPLKQVHDSCDLRFDGNDIGYAVQF